MQNPHPMFVLGQMARCIWRDGGIPQATLTLMHTRPLASLQVVMSTPEAKGSDQSELIRLLKTLQRNPPKGPAGPGQQTKFWLGWYEYGPATGSFDHNGQHSMDSGGCLRRLG